MTKQQAAIKAIQEETKRRQEREAEQQKYYDIVDKASREHKIEASRLAMSGLCPSWKLCYRMGEIRLVNEWNEIPEGFTDSGKVMPCNVEYSRTAQWIVNNSSNLAVY